MSVGKTGGTSAGSPGGGSSGGMRAVDVVLSGARPFRSRAGDAASRASKRHVERFAPEGKRAVRSPALRTLSFADGILSPYVGQASSSATFGAFSAASRQEDRPDGGVMSQYVRPEEASWIFPKPWYLDELSWLAAARATAPQVGRSATSRRPASSRGRTGSVGATAIAPPLPMALVAPSFAASTASAAMRTGFRAPGTGRKSGQTGGLQRQQSGFVGPEAAMRAWTPLVSFPAAQAAEVMQAAAFTNRVTERTQGTLVDEAWALLEYVAPSDITDRDDKMQVTERARGRMERAVQRAAERRSQRATTAQTGVHSRTATERRPSTSASAPAAPLPTPTPTATPSTSSSVGAPAPVAQTSATPAVAARTTSAATGAADILARGADAVTPTVQPGSGPSVSEPPSSASVEQSAAAAPGQPVRSLERNPLTVAELLTNSVVHGGGNIAPMGGPRIALPSGLGGAVAGIRSARSVARPVIQRRAIVDATPLQRNMSGMTSRLRRPTRRAPASVQAADIDMSVAAPGAIGMATRGHVGRPTSEAPGIGSGGWRRGAIEPRSAYRAVTGHRPRSVQHVAWSDRWLARFAGASASGLATLDALASDSRGGARTQAAGFARFAAGAPAPVFIASDIARKVTDGSLSATRTSFKAGLGVREALTGLEGERRARRPVIAQPMVAPHVVRAIAPTVSETRALETRVPERMTSSATTPTPSASARPTQASVPAAPATPTTPSRSSAPVFDDDETVSDEVFAAIAAAAARPPSAQARRASVRAASRRDQLIAERRDQRLGVSTRGTARGTAQGMTGRPAASSSGEPSVPMVPRSIVSRPLVDRLLDFGPTAPGPGMRTALAASPIAPAMNAFLPMPATRSFDVRSLAGSALAHSYLNAVIEPELRFVGSRRGVQTVRSLFAASDAASVQAATLAGLAGAAPRASYITAGVIAPEPTGPENRPPIASQAAPSAASAPGVATVAATSAQPAAPARAPVPPREREVIQQAVSERPGERTITSTATSDIRPEVSVPGADITATQADVTSEARVTPYASQPASRQFLLDPASAAAGQPLSVLSPLLPSAETRALQLQALSPLYRTAPVAAVASSTLSAASMGLNTTDALSLVNPASNGYGPGQTGVRAQSWSAAQERASADLSFDFVTPEMVVAAQAYGFGPAEAARAARLSVTGQAGLSSLASAVDLSFIDTYQDVQSRSLEAASPAVGQAIQLSASRSLRTTAGHAATGQISAQPMAPVAPDGGAVTPRPDVETKLPAASQTGQGQSQKARVTEPGAAHAMEPGTAHVTLDGQVPAIGAGPALAASLASGATTQGHTAARLAGSFTGPTYRPRGAFLWPQAAIAAFGLDVPGGEAEATPFVALDLLAARAVADVGMFVAPDGTPMTFEADGTLVSVGANRAMRPDPGALPLVAVSDVADERQTSARGAGALGEVGRPSAVLPGSQVSGSATELVEGGARVAEEGGTLASELGMSVPEATAIVATAGPRGVPHEFKALYVALSRSPSGRSLSTSVRAARALALARSIKQGGASSAQARAAAAWAVMPMVLPGATPPVASSSWSAGWSPADRSMLSELASTGMDLTFITANDAGRVAGADSSMYLGGSATPGVPSAASAERPGAGPQRSAGAGLAQPALIQLLPNAAARTGAVSDGVQAGDVAQPLVSSSRAGESLRTLVASATNRAQTEAVSRPAASGGAMSRIPTAAPPLVQTGSKSSPSFDRAAMRQMIAAAQRRQSAGDVSIPNWFEKAARQMFDSTGDGGISLAEMTLVATAPAHTIAASAKSASASPTSTPDSQGGVENEGAQAAPDVEAMAQEVYTEIVRLMEVSRERNGEPWR